MSQAFGGDIGQGSVGAEVRYHRPQTARVAAPSVCGQRLGGQELFHSPSQGRHPNGQYRDAGGRRIGFSRDNRQGSQDQRLPGTPA